MRAGVRWRTNEAGATMTHSDPETPMPTPAVDHERELARIERLARLLDSRFRIPGTGIRFGWEGIIGLVPGIGDTVTLAPAGWMVWKARQLGVPKHKIAQMAGNTGIDYVVGLVPIVGDLFDIGFKANLRNAEMLRSHLIEERDRAAAARRPDPT